MATKNNITGDSIQTKHSQSYGERYGMIKNREAVAGCECTWKERVLGDGCQYCNPEMAEEIRHGNLSDPDQQESREDTP